jgi:hypothetical protein
LAPILALHHTCVAHAVQEDMSEDMNALNRNLEQGFNDADVANYLGIPVEWMPEHRKLLRSNKVRSRELNAFIEFRIDELIESRIRAREQFINPKRMQLAELIAVAIADWLKSRSSK